MIIKQVDTPTPPQSFLSNFPSQFVKDTEKAKKGFIKPTLDYFAHIAFAQYRRNKDTFARNYDLLKGIISWKDFYYDQEEPVKDFFSTITGGQELPPHIKHYPIMNRPINTMVGELSKRPDNHRVRAFDSDSRSEEMEHKTDLVQQLILQDARERILMKAGLDGKELSSEDLERLTVEKVQDYLTDYTSLAERWGNSTLTCLKAELSMKDKSEDAFRDLLTSSREFFHIYEDNSRRGFDAEVANTKNVFHSPNNDKKYSKNWYYGGLLEMMEISEIMEKCPWITKEEVDHLVAQYQNPQGMSITSNFDSIKTGPDTIKYDTYSPLIEQERTFLSAELEMGDKDSMDPFFQTIDGTSSFSQKFAVMRVYFISKKLVGKLTYVDQEGTLQTTLVDENYEEGTPGEEAIEWGWVNQWMMGTRIGTEVYHMEPFKLLDYCPIIGVTHEIKNTQAKSVVDMLKSFQSIYNVCLNQLWELLEKEKGNVAVVNIRRVPTPKDGDTQDAIAQWEEEAQERGIVFEDDSPENTRVPSNNTNLTRSMDLTRSKEMAERRELALWIKREAMELIGMSEQRMGGVAATETATGTQAALTQSFAQTEPYFAQHEYVLDQVYQAILDAAQYIESTKPVPTLSYIAPSGESAFLQVTGADIKLKDLHVFPVSRQEDVLLFREIRSLAQPMLQNGAPVETIIDLYATNSIRQMKKIAQTLREKQEQMMQGQQQAEQQSQQQEAQLEQARLEMEERHHQDNIQMEKYKVDVKAQTDLAREQIKTYFQTSTTDSDGDGTPDIMEIADHSLRINEIIAKRDLETQKLSQEMSKHIADQKSKAEEHKLRSRELDIQEKNQSNDLQIQKLKIEQEKIKTKNLRNKPKPKS